MGKGTGPLVGERPKVGQMARHKQGYANGTMNDREVTAVSPGGQLIKVRLIKAESGWLIASRYTFYDKDVAGE